MAIQAVVFDLGGVLENEIDTGMDAKWEARLNLKIGELNERLLNSGLAREATMGRLSEEEMLQKLGEVFGIDRSQVREFMDDIWEQYELNTELAAYFKSLRPYYKTAILSNAWPDARREERARFNFDEMTDLIIYSYEEKTGKPERRIFEITWERLGIQPEEMVFLDNIKENVAAANELGIQAVLFRETTQAIADIQAYLEAYFS